MVQFLCHTMESYFASNALTTDDRYGFPYEPDTTHPHHHVVDINNDASAAAASTATPNFQSSFARSLSSVTHTNSPSLDAFVELNFRIGAEAMSDRHLAAVQLGLNAARNDEDTFVYTSLNNQHHLKQESPPPSLPSSPPPPPSSSHIGSPSGDLASPAVSPTKPNKTGGGGGGGGRMYLPSSTPKRRYMTISSIRSHTASSFFFMVYNYNYKREGYRSWLN